MTAPRPVTPLGILAQRLESLRARAVADGLQPDFVEELEAVALLAEGLEPYLADCTSPESPALAALAERTAAEDWGADGPLEQEMLSGHVEGRFLGMLARATGAKSALDIGMFTGYSSLALAEALPKDGWVVACEADPRAVEVARTAFDAAPAGARIRIEEGPAAHTLDRLAHTGERFDLVFIDADKPGYEGYLRAVLDGDLLALDGLICVDNTLMQGQPWTRAERTANGNAIAAFNQAVVADPDLEQVLVPLRDGVTLIRRADG